MALLRNISTCILKFNSQVCSSIYPVLNNRHCRRQFHSGGGSYEGDGKTSLTVLNQESDAPLMINAFSKNGFKLNNGFTVFGPIAIFPKTILGWNVHRAEDISLESLSLIFTLVPHIDILVFGIGDPKNILPKEVIFELRKRKHAFEILPSDQACATFNFLNSEKRSVAGLIIPPKTVVLLEKEIVAEAMKYKPTKGI